MLNRTSMIFCATGLAIAALTCTVGYSLAALPAEALRTAKTPVPPEALPDIEIPGVGRVSVIDLAGYYIENPPVAAGQSGPAAGAQHFGGC